MNPTVVLQRALLPALQLLLVAGALAWAMNVPGRLGMNLYTEQLLFVALGLALAITFLVVRRKRGQSGSPPWFDQLLALLALGSCGYLALDYPDLIHEVIYRPLYGVVLAGVLVGLVLEAVRRTAGMVLLIVVAVFFIYAMFGDRLPAEFATRPVDFDRLMVYLGLDTSGIIGSPLTVAVTVIIPFLLLGELLSRNGGSDFFTSLSMAVIGRHRGGAAKIAVVGSTLFGSISGSAVANVAGTGVVTIPLMKRSGFPGRLAGGVEAVASTGGQLMPPVMGAAAFLMAEFLEVSYATVMMAAIIPALLYYVALFFQVDLLAARLGLQPVPADRIPDTLKVLREGWYFPLPFAVLLFGLLGLNMRPELAVLLGVVTLVICSMAFGYQGRRLSLRMLLAALSATGRSAIDIVIICAAAGVVIGILNITGGAFGMSLQLIALSGDNLIVLLLLAAVISIILGMGMPTVGVYVLLAALVAPALANAGVEPLVAHFFVLYFGMLSMVTPPIALAAFAAAKLADADFWQTGLSAMQLGWVAYLIPFLFVASPALLGIGEPLEIAWAVLTAIIGIFFVSAGIAGYLRLVLGQWYRLALVIAGLLVLIPSGAWAGAVFGEIIGLISGGLLVARLAFSGDGRATVSKA
ncbi:MAG: TRAP transporter fused permease subunit [Aquisalimonadaceae bacterium]